MHKKEEQYYIIAIDMKGDNSQESDDTIHNAIVFIMFGTRRCQRGNQNQEEFEDA
jgi:hypothetical protein